MKIRFWGVRGSIPSPGPNTVRYGGNTTCVEIVNGAGTRLVIDLGTGATDGNRGVLLSNLATISTAVAR